VTQPLLPLPSSQHKHQPPQVFISPLSV
jgi:hypothetical protein